MSAKAAARPDAPARSFRQLSGEPVEVQGVVVIVNAGELSVERQPLDVTVVDRWRLRRSVLATPAIYEQRFVETAFEVARMTKTWGG